MALERELATYRDRFDELAQHEGKYVLIRGDEVFDTFSTYEDALKQGYRQYGLSGFLVKQIRAVERVHYVTRPLTPVRG
jgi:hypothetical protein